MLPVAERHQRTRPQSRHPAAQQGDVQDIADVAVLLLQDAERTVMGGQFVEIEADERDQRGCRDEKVRLLTTEKRYPPLSPCDRNTTRSTTVAAMPAKKASSIGPLGRAARSPRQCRGLSMLNRLPQQEVMTSGLETGKIRKLENSSPAAPAAPGR